MGHSFVKSVCSSTWIW